MTSSVHCRACGGQLHITAVACPHCGAPQAQAAPLAEPLNASIWMAWTALGVGAVSSLALFSDPSWDHDSFVGGVMFGVIGIALGAISLSQRRGGKAIAITALVLSVVGLLASAGHLS